MSNIDKNNKKLANNSEIETLYQIYVQVQSGDKSALNKLFKEVKSKHISNVDERNKKKRMSDMDNVLDMELVLDREKNKQEEEWINSSYATVDFELACLNKMLYKKKKAFLSKAKIQVMRMEKRQRISIIASFMKVNMIFLILMS